MRDTETSGLFPWNAFGTNPVELRGFKTLSHGFGGKSKGVEDSVLYYIFPLISFSRSSTDFPL